MSKVHSKKTFFSHLSSKPDFLWFMDYVFKGCIRKIRNAVIEVSVSVYVNTKIVMKTTCDKNPA